MNYNWNINDLKKDFLLLKKQYNEETNLIKKAKIQLYIDSLLKIIDTSDLKSVRIPKKACLGATITQYYDNRCYYNYFDMFKKTIDKCVEKNNTTYDNVETLLYDTIDNNTFKTYSIDECLEIAKIFFGQLDNQFYKNFMKIYNDKYSLIKETNEHNDYCGCCYYVNGLNKPYIVISNKTGYRKVNTLIHELGHAVTFMSYPDRIIFSNDNYNNEIESYFMELLFTNEVISKLDKLQMSLINLDNITINYDTANLLDRQKKIALLCKKNIEIDKKFYKNCKNKYNLSKSDVDEAILADTESESSYIISLLISLELYNIYKQDKKDSLKLLKEIIKNYKEDTYITINKYFPNLNNSKKELKKIFNNSYDILKK